MVARTIVFAAVVAAAGLTTGGYALIVDDPFFFSSVFAGDAAGVGDGANGYGHGRC